MHSDSFVNKIRKENERLKRRVAHLEKVAVKQKSVTPLRECFEQVFGTKQTIQNKQALSYILYRNSKLTQVQIMNELNYKEPSNVAYNIKLVKNWEFDPRLKPVFEKVKQVERLINETK